MPCEAQKATFEQKMKDVSKMLSDEMQQVANDTERKANKIADDATDGSDLAQGVGATAGTIIGGIYGGPAGAAAGAVVGKTIGALFKLTVENEDVRASLDVPEIAIKDQRWSFDVPTIEMRQNDIIWNMPTLVMKRTRGPDNPVTVCSMEQRCIGPICTDVPVCKIDMRPTYLDLPTWEDREHRIVVGIPTVVMKRQEVVVGVPEIVMKRQDIVYTVPRIKLEFVKDAGKKTAELTRNLQTETEAAMLQKKLGFRERMRFEVVGPGTAMFDCFKEEMRKGIKNTQGMFDPQIATLANSLAGFAAQNVPAGNPEVQQVKAQMADLIAKRDKAVGELTAALAKLEKESAQAIDRLVNEDFDSTPGQPAAPK